MVNHSETRNLGNSESRKLGNSETRNLGTRKLGSPFSAIVTIIPFDDDDGNESLLYNTILNSDRLIGCLWSRDI